MRFLTFEHEGSERLGVLAEGGDKVLGLPAGVTLLGLLQEGSEALRRAGESATADPDAEFALEGLRVLAPIPAPPTVRDYMTFEKHVRGTVKLADPNASVPEQWYNAPIFYFTNPYATVGAYDDVPVPHGETLFDYELEVAAVAGGGGSDLSVAEAENAIAGYMIFNDWSARSLQFKEMTVRLGPSKGKDGITSMGPWFVTPDELEHARDGNAFKLAMRVYINDELAGEDTWSNMAFSYGQMIAYASRGTEIRPGDIFGSGTSGSGCLAELWGHEGFDAHPPLVPGDVVTVEVEGLGVQRARIVENPRKPQDLAIYRANSTAS